MPQGRDRRARSRPASGAGRPRPLGPDELLPLPEVPLDPENSQQPLEHRRLL